MKGITYLILIGMMLTIALLTYVQTNTNLRYEMLEKEHQNVITKYENELQEMHEQIESLEQNVSDLHRKNLFYEQRIKELILENQKFKSNTIRKSVSYNELMEFLERDRTDQHMYISSDVDETNFFECVQFTYTLLRNAYKEGIFGCPVVIYFPDNLSHMIIAFNTTEGWIFIEPQFDEIVNVTVGERYFLQLNYYADWNDTVIRYETCF